LSSEYDAGGLNQPTLVQDQTASAMTASSLTITLGATPAQGNTLILHFAGSADDPTGVQGAGVTWEQKSRSAQHHNSTVWVGFNVAASADASIVIQSAILQDLVASVSEWAGLSGLDIGAVSDGMDIPIATPSGFTIASAPELLYAAAADDSVTIGSPNNGFTELRDGSIGSLSIVQAYDLASTAGAYATTWNQTGGFWDAHILAFRPK
jgi:hypothetical protein